MRLAVGREKEDRILPDVRQCLKSNLPFSGLDDLIMPDQQRDTQNEKNSCRSTENRLDEEQQARTFLLKTGFASVFDKSSSPLKIDSSHAASPGMWAASSS